MTVQHAVYPKTAAYSKDCWSWRVTCFLCSLQHADFEVYRTEHGFSTLSIVLATSNIALFYNIVHSCLIHKTSAVTVTVLGEIKVVGILLLSAWLLGKTTISAKATLLHAQCLVESR